jgi:hypothetical protein
MFEAEVARVRLGDRTVTNEQTNIMNTIKIDNLENNIGT